MIYFKDLSLEQINVVVWARDRKFDQNLLVVLSIYFFFCFMLANSLSVNSPINLPTCTKDFVELDEFKSFITIL